VRSLCLLKRSLKCSTKQQLADVKSRGCLTLSLVTLTLLLLGVVRQSRRSFCGDYLERPQFAHVMCGAIYFQTAPVDDYIACLKLY
jgi:hypothetical protein